MCCVLYFVCDVGCVWCVCENVYHTTLTQVQAASSWGCYLWRHLLFPPFLPPCPLAVPLGILDHLTGLGLPPVSSVHSTRTPAVCGALRWEERVREAQRWPGSGHSLGLIQ